MINAIRATVARFRSRKNLSDAHRSGRPPKYPVEVKQLIDRAMHSNNELTARQLLGLVMDPARIDHWKTRGIVPDNFSISERTVFGIRSKLGWKRSNVKYAQLVRDANKIKRVDFCRKLQHERWNFKDITFTDECTVQLERHKRKAYMSRTDKSSWFLPVVPSTR